MTSPNIPKLEELIGIATERDVLVKALDEITSAVVVVDSLANIYFVNKMAELMTGFTRAEITGENVNILVPERFKEKHSEYTKQYLTDPKIVFHQRAMGRGIDLFINRKDGTEIPVTIDICPFMTSIGIFVAATIKVK